MPPTPILRIPDLDWPHINVSKNMIDKKLFTSAPVADEQKGPIPAADSATEFTNSVGFFPGTDTKPSGTTDFIDADTAADDWGMDTELEIEGDITAAGPGDNSASAGFAAPESDPDDLVILGRKAVSPVDWIMVGNFEKAMHVLRTQNGVVNFAPLKPYFLEIYSSSRSVLSTFPGIPPTRIPLFKPNSKDSSSGFKVPVAMCRLQNAAHKLQEDSQPSH